MNQDEYNKLISQHYKEIYTFKKTEKKQINTKIELMTPFDATPDYYKGKAQKYSLNAFPHCNSLFIRKMPNNTLLKTLAFYDIKQYKLKRK
ncbi:hypothetical protein A0H76_2660 [Hepatospora eriocheir]|uniref:Uncharacterized protein n=1 Tax=Hepatospora eriocheir TaxID=1081669 RepID=A0A1X0QJJ4_9MICR|nr:hypothetical protein A0H76_2660 [Hepatospora eriocheir]